VALLPRFKTLDALSFAFLSGSLALIGEPSPAPGDPKFQHRNCFDRQRASRARCTKHPDAFSAGRPVYATVGAELRRVGGAAVYDEPAA
jgi:hypothetical protein